MEVVSVFANWIPTHFLLPHERFNYTDACCSHSLTTHTKEHILSNSSVVCHAY